MKNKIIILIIGCITISLPSFGQVRYEPANPYNAYSIGIGVGFSTMYGDLDHSNHEPVLLLNITKHITPAISIGIEAQHGSVSSNELPNNWTTGISETDQYNTANINIRMTLAQLMKNPHSGFAKALTDLYIGTGIGWMYTDMTNISYYFKPHDPIHGAIKLHAEPAIIPFNLGYNIYVKKLFGLGAQININYQINYATNDYVDGYSFPFSKNQYNDLYSVLSVGLSFYIGRRYE